MPMMLLLLVQPAASSSLSTWCGGVLFTVGATLCGYVAAIVDSTVTISERLTPEELADSTREIIPAALADRTLQETLAALTTPNPYAADSVASRARFCLTCNTTLLAYHRLTKEWRGRDGHFCFALTPESCCICRRTAEPPLLIPVKFVRSEELHWTATSMRAAKDISEKKSLQTAITVTAEGRSVTEFSLSSEMMLHFGGLLETLRATPTTPRYRTWFEEHAVRTYLSWAMFLRDYTISACGQAEFDYNHILWCQPNHSLTHRAMCSQWATNATDVGLFESVGDRAKRRVIESVGLQPPTGRQATTQSTASASSSTSEPGATSSAPDLSVPAGAALAELEEMLAPPPGLEDTARAKKVSFAPTIDLQEISHSSGAQALRYKLPVAAALIREQDAKAKEEGGLLPVRVYENMTRADVESIKEHLFKSGRLANIEEYIRPMHDILMLGEVRMKKHREDVKYILKDYVRRVGPLLSNTVVWETKDYVTKTIAAAYRCITPGSWEVALMDPEDEPANAEKRALQKRINRFFAGARRVVFTEHAINKWVLRCPLIEELRGKYTMESMLQCIDHMRAELYMRPATANLKMEVTTKGGKSPRIVIDCGAERTIVETIVAWVFDHVLFDYLGKASIKGKDRTTCLDQITTECSWPLKFPTCLIELDQTGFDAHNRCWAKLNAPPGEDSCDGVFPQMINLYHLVACAIPRTCNELWANFSVIEGQDRAGRAYLKFKGEDKKQSWTALLKELYMLSGRKITSSGNFLSELCILLTSYTSDPERIFEVGGLDTFNWMFRCADGKQRFFRCWLEGDDALARADAWFARPEVKARFLQACKWMGFEAKLVVVTGTRELPARAEFVGAHFLCINGTTYPKFWVPDIARGVVSVGAYCLDPNCLDPAVQCQQIAVSMASRAVGFAGRCEPASNYIMALASEWARCASDIDAGVSAKVVTGGYHAESRGIDGMGFDQLKAMHAEGNTKYAFTYAQQTSLAAASLQGQVTPQEFSRWLANSSSFTVDSEPLDVLESLPSALAASFVSTAI